MGESGTCDSGAGSLFCHPPRAGGSGHSGAPGKREAPAPQQTPLTGPPRLSAPSHLHTPPDPTHRVQARLLAPPSFSLFAIFNPRGNMATDVFHVKGGFFLAPGNQSWRDMDFQMPMSCLRRHLPPRKQEGGGGFHGGKEVGGGPAAHHPPQRGFLSTPPSPGQNPPPPPPSSDPTRMTLFHRPPHHLAPRERTPWAVGVPVRCWKSPPPFFLGLVTCIS